MRLDIQLVNLKIARSRELAKSYIKDGYVFVNDKKVLKPSLDVSESDVIKYIGEKEKYVGRGGLKLEAAINNFGIDINEKRCLDIGASTGGFTDCMLQHGAMKVYAVDVGRNQLDKKLKDDNRVIDVEQTDIRDFYLTYKSKKFDFICTDVSFISLKKITEPAINLLDENGEIVFLIKPQFEVGIKNIGKNGIVKDKKVHINLLKDMMAYFDSKNLAVLNLKKSPIKGGSGNIEYLIHLKLKNITESSVNKIINLENIV